jgi:hypothetical protein
VRARPIGESLFHASAELKADRDVVLQAVALDGNALAHASTELRADPDVVRTAMEQNSNVIHFASAELKQAWRDGNLATASLKRAVRACCPRRDGCPLPAKCVADARVTGQE